MTHKKTPISKSGEIQQVKGHRYKVIRDCIVCGGEPPEEKFELPTMEGICCGICREVLGWKRK